MKLQDVIELSLHLETFPFKLQIEQLIETGSFYSVLRDLKLRYVNLHVQKEPD